MASALGVKRGKVYNINGERTGVGGWGGYGGRWGAQWGGFNGQVNNVPKSRCLVGRGRADTTAETFSAGEISVSATVNVSFLIE